jgi:hypothetical protein
MGGNSTSTATAPHNAQLRIIGAADEDPVGGCVVVGPVGFGDDADAPRLHAQGNDLALKLGLGHLSTVLFAKNHCAIDAFRYRTDRTVFFAFAPCIERHAPIGVLDLLRGTNSERATVRQMNRRKTPRSSERGVSAMAPVSRRCDGTR